MEAQSGQDLDCQTDTRRDWLIVYTLNLGDFVKDADGSHHLISHAFRLWAVRSLGLRKQISARHCRLQHSLAS